MSDGFTPRRRIAVIGAGMAGLTAAKELAAAGASVVVFEKSRGLGGRLATRRPFWRSDDPAMAAIGLDHGAPVAEAEDPELLAALAELGQPYAPNGGPVRGIVGAPGMSDLVAPLAAGLDIRCGVEIAALAQGPEDWLLRDKAGDAHGPFDAVVSAVPAPQAANLLGDACPDIGAAAMAPCWTLLLTFDAPLPAPLSWLQPTEGPFALILRDSAKPGRSDAADGWIAHTTTAWAEAHLEEEKEAMAARLTPLLAEALDMSPPAPRYVAAHRWRYARTARAVGRAFWLSEDGALGCCGDWRLGPTVGDAMKSGALLARAMARATLPRSDRNGH